MERIEIEKTAHQPLIILDPEEGKMSFEGNLVVSDTISFFMPILNWIREYTEDTSRKLDVTVRLVYYNTAASKMILKMFSILKEAEVNGSEINVTWYYKHDDDDMMDVAHETEEICELKFTFVPI